MNVDCSTADPAPHVTWDSHPTPARWLDPTSVTAIITTRFRPQLVQRAVASALQQTHACAEVLVIIDGNDPETALALESLEEPRLRVLSTLAPVGGSEARNIGVRAARAAWIAFLDDDDEWLPAKIGRQLACALQSSSPSPIVSCRVRAKTAAGTEFLWPRRTMRPDEPLADYLLSRNTVTQGEGLIGTSTIFAPRQLLLRIPFRKGLKRHQDWDWLLRAQALGEAKLECVFEPLANWYIEEPRPSVSALNHWQDSFAWIHRVQPFVSPRAYASFLLVFVSAVAARESDYKAMWPIARSALRHGKPRAVDLLLFAAMWGIPQPLRRNLRNYFATEPATA